MRLQIIISTLFLIFSLVYFAIPGEGYELPDSVIYWSSAFFIAVYGLIAGLLYGYIQRAFLKLERYYFIVMFVYFAVLIIMNAVCFIDIDLYAPLLSKTGTITIPFVVIAVGIGVLKILTLKRKP